MTTVKAIVEKIEQLAPRELAEEWDPIGLSFGTYQQAVKKVFVALDVDPVTLEEAKAVGADLIVTHHPLIFNSVHTLNGEDSKRQLFIELIKNDIAVYSAHTNMDRADQGMNEWLADALKLQQIEPMMPLDTDPKAGFGRVGFLNEPLSMEKLINQLKKVFDLSNVRYNEVEPKEQYQKIAVMGGAGADFYRAAQAKDAELYITGDISYHQAQDMLREGLAFIDVGHFVENIFVKRMTEQLENWATSENWALEIIPSQKQKDVFKFY